MPLLKGEFFFDDNPNIVENVAVHITQLNRDTLAASLEGAEAGPLGRPVSVLSFAITHYFFGLNATAFKTINLIIHLVNGLLVAVLISLLFKYANQELLPAGYKNVVVITIMSIWLVHPINIMPIALSVQRMTLLATFFLLIALIFHLLAIYSNKKKVTITMLVASWLVCWPLAILSKESGALFPFYVLLITLITKTTSRLPINKMATYLGLVAFWASLIAGICLVTFKWDLIQSGYMMRIFSVNERLMTESRVVWFYLKQIVFPDYFQFGVYLDDFEISHGLMQPGTTLTAICGWIITVILLITYWRHYTLICFGIAWFLVGHALESTFLPLEIAHEYRNYMPSIGIVIVMVLLFMKGAEKLNPKNPFYFFALFSGAMILSAGLMTWLRANQLGDPLIGAQLEAQRHPRSARANYGAATALFKAGRGHATQDIAIAKLIQSYYEQAGHADPSFRLGYIGLIVWACASQVSVESKWVDELTNRLEKVPFGPADVNLPNKLAESIISLPTCLQRQQVVKIFEAGVKNPTVRPDIKAQFLERLADYEVIVNHDIKSSRLLLMRALELLPSNNEIKIKLDKLDSG